MTIRAMPIRAEIDDDDLDADPDDYVTVTFYDDDGNIICHDIPRKMLKVEPERTVTFTIPAELAWRLRNRAKQFVGASEGYLIADLAAHLPALRGHHPEAS